MFIKKSFIYSIYNKLFLIDSTFIYKKIQSLHTTNSCYAMINGERLNVNEEVLEPKSWHLTTKYSQMI